VKAYSVTQSINAHYILRRKDRFWLLERKDTNAELALFDSQQKALSRAEILAKEHLPSLLEIYHTPTRIEERYYAAPTASLDLGATMQPEQTL
jgi:hypothetical protein